MGRKLDELGITHGGIKDASYGSGVSFRDPDGIPLEVLRPAQLTCPTAKLRPVIAIENFRSQAAAWIAEHAAAAPADYGAICPGDLRTLPSSGNGRSRMPDTWASTGRPSTAAPG